MWQSYWERSITTEEYSTSVILVHSCKNKHILKKNCRPFLLCYYLRIIILVNVKFQTPWQRVSHNFWQTGSEVCSEFLKFPMDLAIWLRSCQWSCELRGEVGKFVAKFGTKFGIEFQHSYEFFDPAKKSHPKNRSGKNCRPLTGRQRTDTNWKIHLRVEKQTACFEYYW